MFIFCVELRSKNLLRTQSKFHIVLQFDVNPYFWRGVKDELEFMVNSLCTYCAIKKTTLAIVQGK